MKRVFLGVCCAIAALTMPVFAAYSDVPADHWAAENIYAATEAGIFEGRADGSFGVGETMTRAQFATALVRFFGWETADTASRFSDVREGSWYYDAVVTAYENGAIPSYSTTFRPTDGITREEMVSMLIRGLGYSTLAGALSETADTFSDVTSNAGFIEMAADFSIVEGYKDGTFRPKAIVTREQAAAVFMRAYDKLHNTSIRTTPQEGIAVLTVETPTASVETPLPTTPLEPVSSLYEVLSEAKDSGADLDRVAVQFSSGGVETKVTGSQILSSKTISRSAVETYLNRSGVVTYYHPTYACGYLTYTSGTTATTVWYQTEESLQEKLALCRMFGVTHYIYE